MSSSADYKCFTSPTEVPVTVYKHQTPKSNAGKLVRASCIKQVHVAVPVICVIMSEKINRVNDCEISEKLCTCKKGWKVSCIGSRFLSGGEMRCANERSFREPELFELNIQQLFKHVAQLVSSEKCFPGAKLV